MHPDPSQHELVGAVQWNDLLQLRTRDVEHELLISLPWLAVSLFAATGGHYVIALGCSFMFFLAGPRYNMFHHFEHHTFPAVPTCKLPILAQRLDAARPDLRLTKVY